MPDIRPCEHLVEYLFEVGPTTGEHALSWQELNAWAERTGVEVDEFEATTIISLSKSYLGMLHEGREWDCPPPHRIDKPTEAKARIARGLRDALHSAAPAPTSKKGLRKRENANP